MKAWNGPMTGENEPEEAGISLALPPEWTQAPEIEQVFVQGYSAPGLQPGDLPVNPLALDLGSAIVAILHGRLRYYDVSGVHVRMVTEKTIKLDLSSSGRRTTSLDGYLLIQLVSKRSGIAVDERALEEEAQQLLGIVISMWGRRIAFQKLFTNFIDPRQGAVQAPSPAFRNPFSISKPEISQDSLVLLSHLATALQSTPLGVRSRIELSLRWLAQATYSEGVDAFLKSWIAVEVLAMPNTTDIRPINEALGSIYSLSREEVAARFLVGRLFGLRGRIVHQGAIARVESQVSDYLRAIHADVLFHILKCPSPRKAAIYLDGNEEVIRKVLVGT